MFAALVPPEEVLDEVERAIAAHVGQVDGLRWPSRVTWHVTLGFFGEVPERALPELEVRLARAVHRYGPFELAFAGFGAFPRVLWAGVTGDSLVRLADSVRAGARRAAAGETDTKRFHPHLTLARSRERIDMKGLAESLGEFSGSAWTASSVHLMRSHLGPPVRYESLAEWAFTPSRGG